MSSFLNQVAKHIVDRHGLNLADVHIVVPTRRSVFFLKRELGMAVDATLLSPQISSIDDFVGEMSGLQTTDPVNLLFTLFEAFQEIDTQVDFNRFMGWGTVLLSDFDRIDMAMVRANYLFDYLTEAKAMERWSQEGIAARPVDQTKGTRHFFSLFENIRKVYERFRERLLSMGLAYPGMAYRYLAEHLALLAEHEHRTFYFAGFNAFTASEIEIVKHLTRSDQGMVLWDSDAYYMTANTYLEAGRYMRRMREQLILGKDWKWMSDNLLTQPKEINLYGVPNATLQTRVAGQIHQELRARHDAKGLTAVVLADENLLTPMLYALDDSVADVNVTMGLPLRNSMIFTLVDAIFELQEHLTGQGGRMPKYNHRYVAKLFTHPFLRNYSRMVASEGGSDFVDRVMSEIRRDNRVFLTLDQLYEVSGRDPLIETLFAPWPADDADVVISRFYEVIDLLRGVYRDSKSPAEQEYLFLFYTLLGKFSLTLRDRKRGLSLHTIRQLLFELMKQNKIPFSGEPISDLQIIGLLETRALDFESVIVLSVNEGILPAKKRQNTLIPFDISKEVGLPTHEHQEALSAYYFYRLLQRSRHIHLLYVNTQDALGGGEKSRFLLQLAHEWPRYNPNVRLVEHTVEWDETDQAYLPIELQKDDAVCQQVINYLEVRGLYPTHIHTLLNSPFDFYLKHVLRMEEEKDTEDTLGMDKLGSWLHNTFELLDIDYFLKGIEPTTVEIDEALASQFRGLGGYETETGINSLYFKVGAQQFHDFMKAQHLKPGHRWPVATEQNLSATFSVEFKGKTIRVKLGGKIDRVELAEDGTLYVMDYKTGSVEVKSPGSLNKDIERYLTEDKDYKMNYVRQLWLYQYLVYREMEKPEGWRLGDRVFRLGSHAVKSGFYSLRVTDKITENPLVLTVADDPKAYIAETERILGIIVAGILDPGTPFVRGEA
jgi:hypothetical protein